MLGFARHQDVEVLREALAEVRRELEVSRREAKRIDHAASVLSDALLTELKEIRGDLAGLTHNDAGRRRFWGPGTANWVVAVLMLATLGLSVGTYWQGQLVERRERRSGEIDPLLDRAFDQMGGKENTHVIARDRQFDLERMEAARRLIDQAKQLDPGYARSHLYQGIYWDLRGQSAKAEVSYREALRLEPEYADAHNNLGNVLFYDRGDLDLAELAYREAMSLEPESPAAYINFGNLHLDQGDLNRAESLFNTALRLDPENTIAHIKLGSLHRRRGDLDSAESSTQVALRLDSENPDAHNNLGNVYRDRGDVDLAELAYREALRLDPKNAVALNNLGLIHHDHGRLRDAVRLLQESLELDPDSPIVLCNLGEVLHDLQDPEGAVFREHCD